MAGKRSATSDLNADNWNQEDEPEEAGTFTKAATEVLQKRVIKTAKRRHTNLQTDDEPANNAFGTFSGFKTTSVCSSPFKFLASTKPTDPLATNKTTLSKVEATNGSIPLKENGIDNSQPKDNANKNSVPSENNKTLPKRPPEYYAKLKGLNQSVAQWIKTHVDSNPVCILTPIFRDYEKHLKEIETKHVFEVNKEIASNENKESKEHSNTTLSAITPSKQEEKLINFKGESKSSLFSSKISVFSSTIKESNSPFSSISTEKNPFLCNPVVIDSKPNENTKVEERASSGIFSQESASSVSFNFGSQSSSISSAGFSFGGNKPFSFGAQVAAPEAENKKNENDQNQDEDDEPPKPDFKPVTEEGSIYEQRCKVFIKKDGKFSDRGIGTLFLKPTPNDKIQLIVRGTNSLGNLILNFLLTESIPIKRMNSTNIMLVCLPMPDFEPPPTAILLRVKTEEDADTLLETLNKHKK